MPRHNEPEFMPDPRESSTEEELQAARLGLAECIVDAMDLVIKTGQWDPREGVAGLEKFLIRDPKRHDPPPSEPLSPRS